MASEIQYVRSRISLTHVNDGFYIEIQADLAVVTIKVKRYDMIFIIDASTKYGEPMIVRSQSAESMTEAFKQAWFFRHGAPDRFSAEHEIFRPTLRRLMEKQGVEVMEIPSR